MNTALRLVGVYRRFWKAFSLHVPRKWKQPNVCTYYHNTPLFIQVINTSNHGSQRQYCNSSNIFLRILSLHNLGITACITLLPRSPTDLTNVTIGITVKTYQKFKHRSEVCEVWLASINLSPQQNCLHSFPVFVLIVPSARKQPVMTLFDFPTLQATQTHTCTHTLALLTRTADRI
jgi:hypothetical protein